MVLLHTLNKCHTVTVDFSYAHESLAGGHVSNWKGGREGYTRGAGQEGGSCGKVGISEL